MNRLLTLTTIMCLTFPLTSVAYIGPGAGLSMLGAVWAVLAAIVFMVGGLLFWPVRAMIRRRRQTKASTGNPKTITESHEPS